MQYKRILIIYLLFTLFSCAVFLPTSVFANNSPDTAHSSLSASNQAPADGSSTINVTVTLQDSSGNPLSGDNVSFSAPNDSAAVFNPSSATLNSSGQATFTVTSTNAETDSINVTDTSSSTTLNGLGSVTFNSNATPTPTCSPAGNPQITSVTSNAGDQVTIVWTDAPDPVDHYILGYGLTSGQYIYGDQNIGGQGTTSFTVNSLSSETTYYFAIKAANSCSTSSYSNELSAVAGGSPTTAPTTDTTSTTSSDQSDTSTADTNTVQDTPTLPTEPTGTPTPTPSAASFSLGSMSKLQIFLSVMGAILIFFICWFIYKSKFSKSVSRKRRSSEEQNDTTDDS